MEKLYLRKGNLIKEEEWNGLIEDCKSKLTTVATAALISDIKDTLIKAVSSRVPRERFGIFFSGGLDSVLIAKICKDLKKDFTCYTVGFYDKDQKYPEDLEWAEKVAKELGVRLKKIILDMKWAEAVIKKTVEVLGKDLNNAINVGVGSVEAAVLENAKQKHFFSGLGSEEVFAGYERHEKADDVNKECIAGLKSMYRRDLLREFAISYHYKVFFLTPFLDHELIKAGLKVPAELKLNKKYKKIILRYVAEELGIPKSIAWRKKRAAQYGSRMDKAIAKLAKKAGYKLKKQYLSSI